MKRYEIITVATEGDEQTFDISEVGSKKALTKAQWIKKLEKIGYSKITKDMIS